jgi:formylmethanofuran dehydrogenase subunit E
MRRGFIECDGCRKEVHDDTVRIAGDRVLCDRCREKIPAGFGPGRGGAAGRPSC